MNTFNTRVAPSPTGHFHLGTARTAYHNWLAARSTGGKFILRIDDTDQNRNNDAYVDLIYTALDWLGIDYDYTFRQSDKIKHYKDIAIALVDAGMAAYDGAAIRLKTSYTLDKWTDFTNKIIPIPNKDADFANNLVLIKSDGYPTYNFATIVDDVDTDINLVIRGADHIANTSKQVFVLQALADLKYKNASRNNMAFCHVGLIMVKDPITQKMIKLSKRNAASNLMAYKDNDYLPDAVLNAVLRLGWAHKDAMFDKIHPTVNKDLAKQLFFQGNLKFANCSFDPAKLISLDKAFKKLSQKSLAI